MPAFAIMLIIMSVLFLPIAPYGIYIFFIESRRLNIIKQNGDLFLRYKHIHTEHVATAMMLIISWGVILFSDSAPAAIGGASGIGILVLVMCAFATVLFGYFVFSGFCNETTANITLNRDAFSGSGPLPPFRTPLHMSNIVSVSYTERNIVRRIPPARMYSIRVTDSYGNSGVLFPTIDHEIHAREIVAQIEKFLKS